MSKKKEVRRPKSQQRVIRDWDYLGPSKRQRDNMINTGIHSVNIINPEMIYKSNPKHKRGRE